MRLACFLPDSPSAGSRFARHAAALSEARRMCSTDEVAIASTYASQREAFPPTRIDAGAGREVVLTSRRALAVFATPAACVEATRCSACAISCSSGSAGSSGRQRGRRCRGVCDGDHRPARCCAREPTRLRDRENTSGGLGNQDGGAGIRTQETLARPTVFKTAPFDRSGTPPGRECSPPRLSIRQPCLRGQSPAARSTNGPVRFSASRGRAHRTRAEPPAPHPGSSPRSQAAHGR